ncbi:MAG: hypothetical protein GEU88_00660 [Solirubrobacterales bacterium]|nr:hypothetical protein [Solirubrobacterales bacterium]
MRRRARDPARRLRAAVVRLPRRTRAAMLRGIDSNRIVVGAYVDPGSGGICPMLAAHRNGGRTNVASFARAWDEYTGARRPRRATRREVRTLRSLLESSLGVGLDPELERTPIAELAAQIRAEREQRGARCAPHPAPPAEAATPTVAAPPVENAIPTESAPPTEAARPVADLTVPEPSDAPIRIRRRQPQRDLLAATEQQLAEPRP